MRQKLFLLSLLGLAACSSAPVKVTHILQPISGTEAEMKYIQDLLTDEFFLPESAKFTHVSFREYRVNGKATRIACGFVNAQNRSGGYVGRTPFMVNLDKEYSQVYHGSYFTFDNKKTDAERANNQLVTDYCPEYFFDKTGRASPFRAPPPPAPTAGPVYLDAYFSNQAVQRSILGLFSSHAVLNPSPKTVSVRGHKYLCTQVTGRLIKPADNYGRTRYVVVDMSSYTSYPVPLPNDSWLEEREAQEAVQLYQAVCK